MASAPATLTLAPAALDRPVATTGCGRQPPGTSDDVTIASDPDISNGATTRSYRLHVPAAYNSQVALPLVLVFHGFTGTAAGMEAATGFSAFAEQRHFLVVYPQGLPFPDSGPPFWASAGPVDGGIDDIVFVSSVLDDLQSTLCVDPSRIFVTGFSNGGGMAGYLACRLASRIAAFAPAAGNFYAVPGGCTPSRPAPILEMHGTADPTVPYAGIPASRNPQWPLPAIPQWLQDWADLDHCTAGPSVFLRTSDVTAKQWTVCQGRATVIHYRLEGAGHVWPATMAGRATIGILWDFFQAHPLPT